ncbi:MAG: hypothetical protein IJY46_00155 [Lentisphaeria bacterium]|nr:hypothetical protein [Lentisphaeria bacterium]
MGYYISSGQVSSGIVLNGLYDFVMVYSGGVASDTTVNKGDMEVENGGVARKTVVDSSGCLYVSGTAENTVVSSGYMHVISTGIASDTTIYSNGTMLLTDAASAVKVTVFSGGGIEFDDSTSISSLKVSSGGFIQGVSFNKDLSFDSVSHNNISAADNVVLDRYNEWCVSYGGFLQDIAIRDRGEVNVFSGGKVCNVTLLDDGRLTVSSGGIAENIDVGSGYLSVGSGGSALNVNWTPIVGSLSMDNTAYITFANGLTGVYYSSHTGDDDRVASHAALCSGMRGDVSMCVMSGGIVVDTTVFSQGGIQVFNGGYVSKTTLNDADIDIYSGGIAQDTTLNGWMTVFSGGAAYNTELFEYTRVESGGFISKTSVNSGWLQISSGGSAVDTVINNSGSMNCAGYTSSAVICSGGEMVISKRALAVDTIVSSGGVMSVYGSASAGNTVVRTGGKMFMSGTHSGRLFIESGATVSAGRNAHWDFTVAGMNPEDDFLINDFGSIIPYATATYKPVYSITVSGSQEAGVYFLAANVSSFTASVTVYDESKNKLCSLKANNGAVAVGDAIYSLDFNSGKLYFYVVGNVTPEAPVISVSTTEWVNTSVTVSVGEVASGVTVSYSIDGGKYQTYTAPFTVDKNCKITMIATNAAGLQSEVSSCTVSNIDKSAPKPLFHRSGKTLELKANDYTASGIHSIEYSFDEQTWFVYQEKINLEQNCTVYARVTDNAGNVGYDSFVIGDFDTVKPVITIIHPTSSGYTREPVAVKVNVTDEGSGVKSVQYRIDDGEWVNGYGASVDENCTIYFKATDNWGNVSYCDYKVANIDRSAPDVIISGVPETWSHADVAVSAAVSDDLSGVKSVQYSFDNKTWFDGTSVEVTDNCTVYFKAVDITGNTAKVSVVVDKIDKVAPVISNVKADITMMTNKDVTVTAEFSDNAELVAQEYSIDGGEWQTYTGSVVMTANGNITFRATDGAGNSVKKEYKVNNIKKEPPVTPEISVTTPGFVTTSVTITAVSDAPIEYCFDNKSFVKTFNRTPNITVTGNTTLYIRAVDSIGNVSETVEYEVTGIDSIADDVRSKYIFIKSSFSSKNTVGKKQDGVALKYLNNAFTKLSAVKADKREGASFVMLDSKITLNSSADLAGIDTLYGSAVQAVATEKKGTYTCKTTSAPRNTVNVSAALADLDLVRFATVNVTGAVGNVDGGKENLTETVKRSEKKGVVTENISYTKTVAASGKVTVTNATAGNISGYSTVTLDNGVAGELVNSNVKITKSEKYIDGVADTVTRTETYTASGTATLKNGSYVESISGFKTVKLTASTVGEIALGDSYTLKKGVKTFKAAGSVTLENASVGSIVGMNKVTASKGFNAIASYTGSDENDTLTINKNAVLALGAVDMGEGAKDKFVNNGTLVLTCDFDRSFISGKGEIVAASDVYETLENKNGVLDLGATAEGFRTTKHENSDDSVKKAVKWDLKAGDYTGWLGSWNGGSDNVDYIKFTVSKNDVDKELCVSGVENFTLFDKKGNEVDIISAAGTYTLKLDWDGTESTSYTLALA